MGTIPLHQKQGRSVQKRTFPPCLATMGITIAFLSLCLNQWCGAERKMVGVERRSKKNWSAIGVQALIFSSAPHFWSAAWSRAALQWSGVEAALQWSTVGAALQWSGAGALLQWSRAELERSLKKPYQLNIYSYIIYNMIYYIIYIITPILENL